MKYSYPDLDSVSLSSVMHALSDEARVEIVRQLIAKEDGECCCGDFCGDLAKATVSHHMRVLREAGLIQHRVEGTKSITFLRREEVAARFPGLWELVGEPQRLEVSANGE